MTGTLTADIVVVGGGVVGTAVAYHLSKAGATICLVEKRGIASGTSGRCEGFILVNDKMPGFDSRLAVISQSMFSAFSDEIGFDIEWRPAGSILIVESEEEFEAAETFCGRLAAEGLPVSLVDRQTVCAMEPRLATDIAGGMLTASDGAVNPMALAQGLTLAARKNGVRILTGNTVRRIRRHPDGTIDRVECDAGHIIAPIVVNAAGVHVPAIGKMVGLDIPVRPRQGQILVTERTFPITGRKMMEFGYLMAKFGQGGYRRNVTPAMAENGVAFVFEPTGAGNYLIGSSRRFTGFDLATDPDVVRAIAQRAVRFYPVLKQVRLIRSYAGLRPYTPDHFPIVSPTDVPGFFIAGGHEGNGITLSLVTGRLMAEMITGVATVIDPRPLHIDRFNKRQQHGQGQDLQYSS